MSDSRLFTGKEFVKMGREARARGRERALYNLEHARKAYALRKEMGKS
jgi:hypothetical protein